MMQDSVSLAKLPTQVGSDGPRQRCDEQLMAAIAAGDRLAMEVLYARHRVRVYRFVLRLVHDTTNAEDITSEVFLEIWKQAHRFEGRSQVSTWMLAIARHRAISALRRRSSDQIDNEMLADIPDSADNAEAILQNQDKVAVLQHCLAQLSPAHREIVDLVYYHGRSIVEVAEITGAPQNTVKTRMFYARKRLAELLHARGLDDAA
jgi:RNA polymerase sigma-70 factor (ECF subfamily)